jgi:putative colanic acid biosynthesis glycosyltransferase
MAKFSIITVTFNNLSGLEKTRASLQAQKCRDFEWIVVDGGSSDGTAEALLHWQSEICAAIREPDNGPYDAMNKGFALAGGEYVLFLNAGDALALPDVLQKLDTAIDTQDFIYGDSLEQQSDGQDYCKNARHHSWRWWGMFASHQSMIYCREFLAEFSPPYNIRYRVGADLDLTLRTLKRTKNILRMHSAIARTSRPGISTAHAAHARREQITMRHEHLRIPALFNFTIMFAQQAVWHIRKKSPAIYNFYRLRNNAVNS